MHARAGLTVYPPVARFIFPNTAEVSKVDYSSKANRFKVRYFLTAKNTVHARIVGECTSNRGAAVPSGSKSI